LAAIRQHEQMCDPQFVQPRQEALRVRQRAKIEQPLEGRVNRRLVTRQERAAQRPIQHTRVDREMLVGPGHGCVFRQPPAQGGAFAFQPQHHPRGVEPRRRCMGQTKHRDEDQ
jgi:hypothetical protein